MSDQSAIREEVTQMFARVKIATAILVASLHCGAYLGTRLQSAARHPCIAPPPVANLRSDRSSGARGMGFLTCEAVGFPLRSRIRVCDVCT